MLFLKKMKESNQVEDDNFFLEDEIEDAKNGQGYEEMNMDQEGRCNDDLEEVSKQERQIHDSEKGHFLQKIYA